MANNIPHSNVAGANVLSTIRMLYTSAAMASLERLPEAPVNRGLFKIFQALFSFFGHSPHRRVPLWAEQVPDQEQTGIQRSECHHHHRSRPV